MPPPIVIVALVLIGGAVWSAVRAQRERTRQAQIRRCESVRRELEYTTDPAQRASLASELRQCAADFGDSVPGLDLDDSTPDLTEARAASARIDALWAEYRTTADVDFVRRSNVRGQILVELDTIHLRLLAAAKKARTIQARADVKREIEKQLQASLDRAACFVDGGQGCGRSGVSEPDWDERARDELQHGAFALGLYHAIHAGWRSARDLGDPPPSHDAAVGGPGIWFNWTIAYGDSVVHDPENPLGNAPPASLVRIGEIAGNSPSLTFPQWDSLGGGPHYAGQSDLLRSEWRNSRDRETPWRTIADRSASELATAAARTISTRRLLPFSVRLG